MKKEFMALVGGAILASITGCGSVNSKGKMLQTQIVNLTTNGLTEPLCIDSDTVFFGWQMDSAMVGAKQSAYEITVKDERGTIVWNSGRVESDESQFIAYKGSALEPKTQYFWNVAVTDGRGEVHTAETLFETSFLDTSRVSWGDADWIGSREMYFDAASASYFSIDASLFIPEGSSRAAFVLGADDFRLKHKNMNIWGAESIGYVKYEIDISDAQAPLLNIYVVGMPSNGEPARENAPDEPDYKIAIPADAIRDVHSAIQLNINTTSANINAVSCFVNGVCVDSARQLNPLGNTQDYNSFPNVNKIGFAVPAGEKAFFSDIVIHYPGKYEEKYAVGNLFSATEGATYAIFEGLQGVTVDAEKILVEGGENGVLAFADPSYGSAPMLRTEFPLRGEIQKARAYISAQGTYEAYINGNRVGDSFFAPGCEDYSTYMPYQVYDVTDFLKTGENAFGVQLAEGWWSGYQTYTAANYSYYGAKQAVLVRLEVTYADGTRETIVSNPNSWKVYNHGAVEYADHYNGERYNAKTAQKMQGWTDSGYDDSDWEMPVIIEPRNDGFLFVTRYDEPIRVVNELGATYLGESARGSFIYDMGENVAGVPHIVIPAGYADDGSEIIVRYAEVLYPDVNEYKEKSLVGQMMVENLRAALCTDFYTAVAGEQIFEPHFTFHGYRYIEITGLKKALPEANVKTEVISSIKTTSLYHSSNKLADRLFKNVKNSQTSNFISIPTDCPQRNERLGWTGDAQVFSGAAAYNADVYNFYREYLRTLRAVQNKDGSLPVYAPTFESVHDTMPFGFEGISWDAALMIIPYTMWKHTGNLAIVQDNIGAIEKWFDYHKQNPLIIPTNPDDLSEGYEVRELTNRTGFLADWLSLEETSAGLINHAVYVYLLDISSQMAFAIGNEPLGKDLKARYEAAKEKWNELYVDSESGKTKSVASPVFSMEKLGYVYQEGSIQDTEASYATPLRYGVFSDENRERAAAHYVETVRRAGHKITSGFSGTPNLLPVLCDYGYIEDAYQLFEQKEYASWLYPVQNGATSVWERWNSFTKEGGFNGNNSMNSFNHFSLGAITEWIMSYQLGIMPSECGYKNFVLQPTIGGSFTNAGGSFASPYGTITSEWKAKNGTITEYKMLVPANTSATLYLPLTAARATKLKLPDGVSYIGQECHNGKECAQFAVEAGFYTLKL